MADATITTRMIEANGLTFETDICGTGEKFALLLHGFPETKFSWRHQMPLLANLGYTAWAPNLRGYGGSSMPEGVDAYHIDRLTDDVAGLIDAAGASETLLIAHDWGGVIAWVFAMKQMRPLSALITMNIPHPACMARELASSWDQRRKSWYMFLFQLPRLPEWGLTRKQGQAVARAFTNMAIDKSRFPKEVTAEYVANALRPGGMTAMINYYRAGRRAGSKAFLSNDGMVRVRTLLIWGEKDAALAKATTFGTERYVPDLTVRYLPNVSHWVQQEAPEAVNAMMEAFIHHQTVPEFSAINKTAT
ncbi:MAG TPA: epoxide hydrolase [Alphaproteobacteria bacterium]|nr:epoxide hydrolase [Alphaproteobacteria bacterium]